MNFKKFGKYTIIKKLASGGMADILLASDLSPTGFGRFVVIKRALPKFSENEEFKDMFKNEGKVACNLKHRNITPIYEFGVEKNQFFLSMEYISGRNLRELIKKLHAYKGSISIPNAVHIIKEVASGLNYAHNAIDSNTGQPLNLIHRDISPQNIMLSFEGEIKLIDFGIAKIADTNLTRAGHLKGKFSYMSPEQAYARALDERTDIFCLGIILWELLTNQRLFASKNELTSLKKIKNCDIPNSQKINPKIPTELNNIVKKALSKNKNSRYKTASKLEQDLSIFLNKNYPEYSHYDFISLMKTTYRKEIMEERETLKNYASEFKKYINTLNLEEDLRIQVDLNVPDLSTLIESNSLQQTKSLLQSKQDSITKSTQSLSEYEQDNLTQTQDENLSQKSTGQIIKEHSSTLIQRKNFDTLEGKNTTATIKKEKTKTHPIQQDYNLVNDGSSALKTKANSQIINQKDFFKTTQDSHISSQQPISLYDKKELVNNWLENNKKQKQFLFFPILHLTWLIIALSAGVYWMKKNNLSITNLIKNTFFKQAPTIQIHQENPPLPVVHSAPVKSKETLSSFTDNTKRNVTNRKVLISSAPSGAAIFINDQFSSKYTPSLIILTANKVSNITLKKEGYFPKKLAFDPKEQNNNSLNVNLIVNHQRNISSEKIHIIQ